MDLAEKELINSAFILEDILSGDPEALKLIQNFDMKKIQTAIDFIKNNDKISDQKKFQLLEEEWRLNYRDRPPTIEEFISEKYLGEVGTMIYPHVRQTIIDFFDQTKPYRNLILYPSIGWGKSFTSNIIQMYIGMHISMMRSAHKFLGVNVATPLTQLLVSYTQTKTSELLLEPLMNMLAASPFFEKVHTQEGMIKRDRDWQHQGKIEKIFWTTATTNGSSNLQFSNGSNFKIVSQVQGLLGLTVVSGTMSELAFFRDAGKALTLDTKIKTPTGFTLMKDIKIGDFISHPTLGTTEVIDIPWEGCDEVIEIEFDNGKKVKCNKNHIWNVSYRSDLNGNKIWENVKTDFILENIDIFDFDIPDLIVE